MPSRRYDMGPTLTVGPTIQHRLSTDSSASSAPASRKLAIGLLSPTGLLVFHLVCFAVDGGAYIWEAILGSDRLHFGGFMDYLTLWGELTQALYMGFALFCDVRVQADVADAYDWFRSAAGSSGDINYFRERVVKPETQRLLAHRDRFFALAFVTGNMVGLGYWTLLFPSMVRSGSFANAPVTRIVLTLLQHLFTFIAVWGEMLLNRHVYGRKAVEVPLVATYGLSYLAWNLLSWDENHVWVYPSVQAGHTVAEDVVMYGALGAFFVALYFAGRAFNGWWWARRLKAAGVGEGLLFGGGDLMGRQGHSTLEVGSL